MDTPQATRLFESLASGVRIDAVRLLVRHEPDGLVAGEMAARLGLAPNALSFHLKALTQATLLSATPEGRFVRYRANLPRVLEVIGFLTAECCSGQPERCGDIETAMPGCASTRMTLPIVWQRLLDDAGDTCPRCATTGEAVTASVERLRAVLAPLGIEPKLEVLALDAAAFARDPLASNRVWIAGRPLEDWLGAETGRSPCCDACGDAECRTLELDGQRHEAIPGELLLRAALLAVARLDWPTALPCLPLKDST